MNFNPFRKKENSFENENKQKIKEVLSFIKELAHDSIFEDRKKYHVDGTQPVRLLDKISRRLMGLSGGVEAIDPARLELLEVMGRVLEKAKIQNDKDVEKIEKVIALLNQPEIFSNREFTYEVASEIGLFDFKPQILINRNEEKSKIIEKQDYWEKPDASLN